MPLTTRDNECPAATCSKKLSHDLFCCLGHWRELSPWQKEQLRSTRRAFVSAKRHGAAYEIAGSAKDYATAWSKGHFYLNVLLPRQEKEARNARKALKGE